MILFYYPIAYVLLVIYGAEVCPYLESLGTEKLALNMALFLLPVFALRLLIMRHIVDNVSLERKSSRQFRLDLLLFFLIGFLNTIANMIFLKFPVGSGLKITLGYLTVGFFASIDGVLYLERRILRNYQKEGQRCFVERGFFSMPKKFAIITIIATIFIAGIIFLLIVKDFQWLQRNMAERGLNYVRISILKEFSFVLGVISLLGIRLIYSYAKNLRMHFEKQTSVLEMVSGGDLDQYVPVVSSDEFGKIAGHTNGMIDALREKRRISEVFGKIINPAIARRLITDEESEVVSSRRELVVLFSDIRNFTTFSEQSDPEDLVQKLNRYFSGMVPVVHKHGGIVDKFIGDGMLAFFGLNGEMEAPRAAVRAGLEMVGTVPELNNELKLQWQIGVGVHIGETVAGLIGSPERMEYTVIGDPVNTASRIESLNKETGTNLLISEAVYSRLGEDRAETAWTDFGKHILKGKSIRIRVYGINAP